MGMLQLAPTTSFKVKLRKETHVTKCNLLYSGTHKRYIFFFIYLVFRARKVSAGNAVSQRQTHTR